jgi:hypothetical protein
MFGLGEDSNDDKLKKNMEDIKSMIEGQEKKAAAPENKNAQQTGPSETKTQNKLKTGEARPEPPETQEVQKPEPDEQQTGKNSQRQPESAGSTMQQYKKPESGLRGVSDSSSNTSQLDKLEAPERQQKTENEVGEPNPQKEEQSSTSPGPKSEGSQLFIRKQRFRQVMNMIGEMRELSDEMKRMTDNLQKGLDKDKKTAQDLENLNKKISSYNQKVENEVAPDE